MAVLQRAVSILLYAMVLLSAAWACAALWFDGPSSRPLAGLLAAGFVLATIVVLIRFRPVLRATLIYAVAFAALLSWWLAIEPSNDREWLDDVARLPAARLEGNLLTVENVRNFDYRAVDDYTERWETRTYDLSKLEGVDLFLSYWGSPYIAHTFVSWVFDEGPPLTISIETRKEVGESYSAVKGFFRHFELYYVVSDERDVARLRTDHRDEDVYLYRLRSTPEQARALLLDYVESINALHEQAAWYNAIEHNCTTSIARHLKHVVPERRFDWRLLVNGLVDRLGYEHGTINSSIPFDELRRRSHINQRAPSEGEGLEYSAHIRSGLPARPTAD